jgi:uncharacterized RDD family membrane protein YckC
MNEPDQPRHEELHELLSALHRRVQKLTVAVVFMAMAVLLLTAAVLLLAAALLGSLVNYFGGDPMLFGAASVGAALLGFACGWFARKRA